MTLLDNGFDSGTNGNAIGSPFSTALSSGTGYYFQYSNAHPEPGSSMGADLYAGTGYIYVNETTSTGTTGEVRWWVYHPDTTHGGEVYDKAGSSGTFFLDFNASGNVRCYINATAASPYNTTGYHTIGTYSAGLMQYRVKFDFTAHTYRVSRRANQLDAWTDLGESSSYDIPMRNASASSFAGFQFSSNVASGHVYLDRMEYGASPLADAGSRTTSDSWAWSETSTGAVSTRVQKWQGGRFYTADGSSATYLDSSKRVTEQGTATAAAAGVFEGNVFKLADTGSGYTSYTLTGPAASNNGQTNLTVDEDVAVCLDAGAYDADATAAINVLLYQDSNNWYRLEVAKTAGGTSTLYKKSGGSESSVATVTKGVATSSTARVQLYRNGGSALGIVVDGTATTYSDGSPLSGPFTVYLGTPASSGTSDNRVDNIDVCYGTKVRVLGCPTGGGAAIYDSGGSLLTSAAESSGTATLDLAGQQFPFTGHIKVLSSTSPVTAVGNGRFPYSGTTTFYGGDDYYYDPATSTGLTGLKALTATADGTYATTQTGSHNGVVVNGTTTYGVSLGFNGKVVAFSYDSSTGAYTESEIGTHSDMHSTCDVQADSSGYLHFVYGGSTYAQQTTKYRKSNTTWSITDLGSETDLSEKIRGSLLIDASDNLFLVGSRSNASSYDQMVSKKRTAAGSWQSTVVLADADASWQLYPCDATFGRDSKLHGMWMAYSAGTGFEHAFHAKSTDGSTWTGITGTSLTLPLTQNNTTGKLSNSATLAADGDYGVSRLTVDSDGTVHAVIGRNSSTYAYFQADTTSGWPASPNYSFTGTTYSNHGVIERFGSYLVYLTSSPTSGPTASLYRSLTRWLSQDDGVTWNSSTLYTTPTDARGKLWWPKLTPVTGSAYAKVLFQGRGTVYGNMDGASPLSGYGQSSLLLADVNIVLLVDTSDTWAWSETATQTHLLNKTTSDAWAWSETATQTHLVNKTTSDAWAWSETASGIKTVMGSTSDTWAWSETATRTVSFARGLSEAWGWSETITGLRSTSRTTSDAWAWSDAASGVLNAAPVTYTRTTSDTWLWIEVADQSSGLFPYPCMVVCEHYAYPTVTGEHYAMPVVTGEHYPYPKVYAKHGPTEGA